MVDLTWRYSRHATGIKLLVFDGCDEQPIELIALDPNSNRSGDIWHAQLSADFRSKSYALRVDGPWSPEHGHRFDSYLPPIDPYAAALTDSSTWHALGAVDPRDEWSDPVRSARAVVAEAGFDWQGDVFPRLPWSETVIYETHVRGLTVQIKNFFVTLLVSRGIPMLLGGDEFRRTQQGNNNAYCQDNEISWYDWRLAQQNADLQRFVSRLIAFRKAHSVLRAEAFYLDAEIVWLGIDGSPPEWHSRENRIGCMILGGSGGTSPALCLLFNAALRPRRFVLPAPPAGTRRVAVDTARTSPEDIPDRGYEQGVVDELILAERSSVILTC